MTSPHIGDIISIQLEEQDIISIHIQIEGVPYRSDGITRKF